MPESSGASNAAGSPDPATVAAFAAARAHVLAAIADACAISGRDPSGVTLVAVSKTVETTRLRAAVQAGLTLLGENRVQEAEAKVALLPGARWHLVGPLQANKARRAVAIFDMIESVDSVDLAVRLDRVAGEVRPGRRLAILLQVNVDADPAKAGFAPEDLPVALPVLSALPNLDVQGLMTVGRLAPVPEDARATFRALRTLSEGLRGPRTEVHGGAGVASAPSDPVLGPALSMGMSDDFAIAIEEGATIVRVGRALFGERVGPAAGGRATTREEAAGPAKPTSGAAGPAPERRA